MPDPRENRWGFLPIAGWLRQYQPAWLRFDLVAGVTLAAYAVPLSLVFASAVIGLVLVLFTGFFQSLPEAVLAAIVLIAVKGLIDLKELRYLWHASRVDFGAAGVALVGVLVMGILDGPLAFDNAISPEAAQIKKISSPVAGQADILLVPDLEAGNMLAKQLSYLAGAERAGIVLGARVPIVLTSRADSVRTRLGSTAACCCTCWTATAWMSAPWKS